MQSITFTCVCHLEFQSEDEEVIFLHISECEAYRHISPISEIFDSIPLRKLDLGQLIALKTEYNMYLKVVDDELSSSLYYKKKKSNYI